MKEIWRSDNIDMWSHSMCVARKRIDSIHRGRIEKCRIIYSVEIKLMIKLQLKRRRPGNA